MRRPLGGTPTLCSSQGLPHTLMHHHQQGVSTLMHHNMQGLEMHTLAAIPVHTSSSREGPNTLSTTPVAVSSTTRAIDPHKALAIPTTSNTSSSSSSRSHMAATRSSRQASHRAATRHPAVATLSALQVPATPSEILAGRGKLLPTPGAVVGTHRRAREYTPIWRACNSILAWIKATPVNRPARHIPPREAQIPPGLPRLPGSSLQGVLAIIPTCDSRGNIVVCEPGGATQRKHNREY